MKFGGYLVSGKKYKTKGKPIYSRWLHIDLIFCRTVINCWENVSVDIFLHYLNIVCGNFIQFKFVWLSKNVRNKLLNNE